MDLQLIFSIVGGIIITYFVSREEDKGKVKMNKKYKTFRPVLKHVLAEKNIDLSDEAIKGIHKTMKTVVKKRGAKEFDQRVMPEVVNVVTQARRDIDSGRRNPKNIGEQVAGEIFDLIEGGVDKSKFQQSGVRTIGYGTGIGYRTGYGTKRKPRKTKKKSNRRKTKKRK